MKHEVRAEHPMEAKLEMGLRVPILRAASDEV
jgi:hypothetical protein